ncbi:competence type IV pilus major pilin ComGC [Streptococcus massiliensis]|uniref:Putative competence protein ComYC n=1 Tax=Streptococcus massiliensis TaxID=313439 RepID=A0A380KWT5_9STRE|nr:competence type IV pilus major pilin ComGC [Streptococcus massiliensis]SUN76402.1 putative competence protein ComYC [Streptococcus massiliensis]
MKKLFLTIKKSTVKAFTLIEMLVVLLIISVLMLLFVPNLTKQKDAVTEKGNAAVVKVVESQAELYALDHPNDTVTVAKLQMEGKITDSQAKAYRAYYAKNTSETPNVGS